MGFSEKPCYICELEINGFTRIVRMSRYLLIHPPRLKPDMIMKASLHSKLTGWINEHSLKASPLRFEWRARFTRGISRTVVCLGLFTRRHSSLLVKYLGVLLTPSGHPIDLKVLNYPDFILSNTHKTTARCCLVVSKLWQQNSLLQ